MRNEFLHQNATATHLAALRIWVFGMWFADVLKDPLSDLATIPFSYFEPVGVLRWFPAGFWSAVHSEPVLRIWWVLLLVLLALSALGTPFYRVVAAATCIVLTFYQGIVFGFADVTHAELAALYTAYILAVFPSADGLALRRTPRAPSPNAVYQAALVMATIVLLTTYMLTGMRRIFTGGLDIFLNGTILSMVADGSATPDHLQQAPGLRALETPLRTAALQIGFAAVTVFEILSLLCLSSKWFRRCWLAVMLPFHVLSWPLLQTLFVHNILLIFALVFDVDGIARLIKRMRVRLSFSRMGFAPWFVAAALALVLPHSARAQVSRPIVAVFAHPDDERIIGPLLSRLAREGRETHLVIATDGSKGVRDFARIPAGAELAAVRAKEAACAAKRLGVRQLHLLGLPDGGLASFDVLGKLRSGLVAIIDSLRPAAIITFGPEGGTGHPDHRLVGDVVTQIVQSDARYVRVDLLFASLPTERLATAPAAQPTVNGMTEVLLTVRVPFEERDLVAGREEFACHRSQYTSVEMDAINRYLAHAWNGRVWLRPWNGTIQDKQLFSR